MQRSAKQLHKPYELTGLPLLFLKAISLRRVLSDQLLPEKEAAALLKGSIAMERLVNPVTIPQFIAGKAETVAQELKAIKTAFGAD